MMGKLVTYTCTKEERELLDLLKKNLSGRVYVKRGRSKTASAYEDSRISSENFYVRISGGGGPEPEWVYQQPSQAMSALIRCVNRWGKAEVNDK